VHTFLPRQSEVRDFVAALVAQNIGRLQVAVDDALALQVAESLADLPEHI
jgi:hypothetical protein